MVCEQETAEFVLPGHQVVAVPEHQAHQRRADAFARFQVEVEPFHPGLQGQGAPRSRCRDIARTYGLPVGDGCGSAAGQRSLPTAAPADGGHDALPSVRSDQVEHRKSRAVRRAASLRR